MTVRLSKTFHFEAAHDLPTFPDGHKCRRLHGHSFRKQVELLDQAAETVLAMVKQLRKGTDIRTAREMNARLQSIEGDADKLELELLRDLYHGDYSAKHIIFLRDLYELLEKVIDRSRDAGNIILQVVLKYS